MKVPSTSSVAEAADSLLHFEFLSCARLGCVPGAVVQRRTCRCGDAHASGPLGSAVAGGAAIARFWQSSAISRIFPNPPDLTAAVLWLATLLFVLALIKNAFAHAQHRAFWRLRTGVAESLANRLFERYLTFGKAWFDRNSAGHAATLLDYRNEVALVFGGLLRITSNTLLLGAYMAVMLLTSWRLTLIAAVLFPALRDR
jgi:ABC-type multidrug transport system fused ATPase/permease subunit